MLKKPILSCVVALAAVLGFAACDDNDDDFIDSASILVTNQSDFAIVEIFLSPVGDPNLGPNLLRGDVLLPGEELLLGVPCDFYDAFLVDEDGVECDVPGIDLCGNDATWVIENDTCTVFELAARARAAALVDPSLERSPATL